uniref:Transmembrane protein n=1 Tax=Pithovirus LCPAC101 TaxID=2506586 RepID=A0A481Z3F5_9VIRU|nr:MAG: hypothetical protein LCPAC101_03400 [Pithovirus LCPAC101]
MTLKYIILFIFIQLTYSISITNIYKSPILNTNNIDIAHNPVNSQSNILWQDHSNNLWISFINYGTKNTSSIKIISEKIKKGSHQVLSFDPFLYPNYNQDNPMIMAYLTESENSDFYHINIETSYNGGYNWIETGNESSVVYSNITPIPKINKYTKLVFQIDRPYQTNNTRHWLLCYETNNGIDYDIGCYVSYYVDTWDFVSIDKPKSICRDIIIAPVWSGNFNLMIYCSDDNITYVQRNYVVNIMSFTIPPAVSVAPIPDTNIIVGSDIYSGRNIYYRTLTNKYVLASSGGIALGTNADFNYTDYTLSSTNDERYILDLKDNNNFIYIDYTKTNSSISLYNTNNDLETFTLAYEKKLLIDDDENLFDISLTSNYDSKNTNIYCIFSIYTNEDEVRFIIWTLDWSNLIVNDAILVLDKVIIPPPSDEYLFESDAILYGDIIINSTLTISTDSNIVVDGNIKFTNHSVIYMTESSTITIKNNVTFAGTIHLPSYNTSKVDDVITIVSYNTSTGKFDNVIFEGEGDTCTEFNLEDGHPDLQYTSSSLQIIISPCSQYKEEENFNIIIFIILATCSTLFLAFVIIVYVKFKDKIFIYRKKTKNARFDLQESNYPDYGSNDEYDTT